MGLAEKNARLPKSEILRGYGAFDLVFQKGKAVHKSHTILFYLKAQEKKVGFTVAKRVRTAVHRNKLKRKLREIYRLNKSIFPEKFHFILLAKGTSFDFHELKAQILQSVKEMRRLEKVDDQ